MQNSRWIALAVGVAVAMAGCQTTQIPPDAGVDNVYTTGNVALHIKKGSTKTEVLQAFGAPNLVTRDGRHRETWAYQKDATVTRSTQSNQRMGIAAAMAGTGEETKNDPLFSQYAGGFAAGAGADWGQATAAQSQRTMTLVIHFDSNDRVSDFRSLATSF